MKEIFKKKIREIHLITARGQKIKVYLGPDFNQIELEGKSYLLLGFEEPIVGRKWSFTVSDYKMGGLANQKVKFFKTSVITDVNYTF